jgi:hypothetical protein
MKIIDLDESLVSLFEKKELPVNIELSKGTTGSQVRDYQSALQSLGISPGRIDGIFGHETKAATIVFQNKHDLRTDGIAGIKTLTKLNAALKGDTSPIKKQEKKPKWGRVKPETAEEVYNFFEANNFTPVQSAALVGNFSVESLWTRDPAKALNPNDTNNQSSHGLAQWQGPRWKNLGRFHNTQPENTNLKQQLQFVVHELGTTHAKAGRILKNITGTDENALKQAVIAVRKYYEVAAPSSDFQRMQYAKLALEEFSDSAEQEAPI